ncbi:MAG TPA: hypothetical protein VMZ66_10710 [Aeromicrobium sp.]|nr:hypothetical protein [Aeromicrobium sp.]
MFLGAMVIACSAPARPLEAGEQSCLGLAERICIDVLGAAKGWTSADVVGYRVQCTDRICDDQSGSLSASILWSDGTRTDRGFGWGNGYDGSAMREAWRPLPTPPVRPTCVGVPVDQCEAFWTDAMIGVTPDQVPKIASVRVECTTTCSEASGEARSVVRFNDGSEVTVSMRTYGAAPELTTAP